MYVHLRLLLLKGYDSFHIIVFIKMFEYIKLSFKDIFLKSVNIKILLTIDSQFACYHLHKIAL